MLKSMGVSPDFSDERLINILSDFIKELARLYDGDERIAYITTGLLGHWGEWHFSACPEAEPTDEQKAELANWYLSWLDAPETRTIPAPPVWLDKL